MTSALVAGAAVWPTLVRADEVPITATMSCERAVDPGRVRCSVEARATGGRSIAWADVTLVELPEFLAALRGRIGPADAIAREDSGQKWAFGLVARKHGHGEARARVRAVICEPASGDAGPSRCMPTTIEVRADVHVG